MSFHFNNQTEIMTAMLDHIPILAALIDKNQVYLHVNQPFADFHQNTKDFFIGKTVKEVLPPASYDRVAFPTGRVLDGETISFENSVRQSDESVETFLVTYTPIITVGDTVEVYLATMDNISQQKETEEELGESLAFTQKLVDVSPVGILFMKPDGEITYENPAMLRIMGVPEGMTSQVIGKNILQLPPIIECGAAEYLKKILTGKTSDAADFTYTSLVGKKVELEAFAASYRDRYHRLSGAILLVLDVTDKKKAESQLLESEDRYRKTFMTSPDAISINRLDDGEYIDVNEGLLKITGYSSNEVIGRSSLELNIWADPGERARLLKILRRKGKAINLESKFRLKNGKIVHALLSAVIAQLGGAEHIISITRPIEDIKKIQSELVKAKDKAQESDRLKSAFLANMSHEIRTPLNSILGFTDLLKTEEIEKHLQKDYLKIIHRSGEKLLKLINELIDLSKIEAGQIILSERSTSLTRVFNELNQVYLPICKKRNLGFHIPDTLDSDLTCIHTDPDRLTQILSNLVENAIKYTNEGEISIDCRRNGDYIQFNVRDTGIGIEKNQQSNVFEEFRQISSLKTKTTEGAGLGLAICKSYVLLMGGTIGLESTPGKGSTFYFTIPYRLSNTPK